MPYLASVEILCSFLCNGFHGFGKFGKLYDFACAQNSFVLVAKNFTVKKKRKHKLSKKESREKETESCQNQKLMKGQSTTPRAS